MDIISVKESLSTKKSADRVVSRQTESAQSLPQPTSQPVAEIAKQPTSARRGLVHLPCRCPCPDEALDKATTHAAYHSSQNKEPFSGYCEGRWGVNLVSLAREIFRPDGRVTGGRTDPRKQAHPRLPLSAPLDLSWRLYVSLSLSR